jgi:hypothetical protein
MVVHCGVVELQICVLGYSSRVLTLLRGQVNRGSGGENRNWELKGPVLRTAVLQSGAMSNVVVAVEVEFVEREEHMTIGEEGRGERGEGSQDENFQVGRLARPGLCGKSQPIP